MLNVSRTSDTLLNTVQPFDDAVMFELAPVSVWLEDYRALMGLFKQGRDAGVASLVDYLRQDLSRVKTCSDCIRLVRVNQKTLALFEATDLDHLVANLGLVFHDDMVDHHIQELAALWDGHRQFQSNTVNHSLSGRRLDIQLKGTILPGFEESWARVLVAVEDVTERETARRQSAESANYALGLFQHSPVSLWVEDFSSVKRLLDEARACGIDDFRVFTDVHPEFVEQCLSEVHVLDVNQHTLDLFCAPDKPTLLKRVRDVFRGNMLPHFREQLVDLWDGKLFQRREVVNYTLEGAELHVHMQFSVLPGHERDWSLVQVALTDITARKRAEAYLEYLGKHDVLTKLYNRSFYNDEINRLDRQGMQPVTIIVADLNGLKTANDTLGHAAGDSLLARAGEVLNKAVDRPASAARIGGDEFAILVPGGSEADGAALMEAINQLVELNNQFHSGLTLSLCMGMATSRGRGERLEAVAQRADAAMYDMKDAFYSLAENDRREPR